MSSVADNLRTDIAAALKNGDKQRAEVLRMLLAAVRQNEIDSGTTPDDAGFFAIVEKMIKQRRDSIGHFQSGGRADLAAKEEEEIKLLQPFLPASLSEAEVQQMIDKAIAETGASSMKDMGKVMAIIKPQAAGRADISQISAAVKETLKNSAG